MNWSPDSIILLVPGEKENGGTALSSDPEPQPRPGCEDLHLG